MRDAPRIITLSLDDLDDATLHAVALEHMLTGHLIDRALMPQVTLRLGLDAVEPVAIEEWMAASPVYTRRMRHLMRIDGDDVGAIFKALQLDVGFVHEYMDVRYDLVDARHGSFRLAYCGALMDVEPYGEAQVIGMCHHIEDPTFDATALATNPRARVRPVHRPPREPADRGPHCHWTVEIDPANEPIAPFDRVAVVDRLPLARLGNGRAGTERCGPGDVYDGPFDPEFRLSHLSHRALAAVAREFAMQTHLIVSATELALRDRGDAATAREILRDQWRAVAWVTAERHARVLAVTNADTGDPGSASPADISPDAVATVATVLAVTPAIPPGFSRSVTVRGRRITVDLSPDDPALLDPEQPGWIGLLAEGDTTAVEATASALAPGARTSRLDGSERTLSFEVLLPASIEVLAPEPREVALTRLSGAASWEFSTPVRFVGRARNRDDRVGS